ncbi:hypothetical protein NEDG_01070 [Nematocida displodere]|uniref:Uncharacterized protein n=1 Tax=Nematocida displodere TaxID=1805483 RepID=A0A177EBQ4_9MICR|nr:hypothetical protein NEDG_01070 [Nematocida displodere]
MEDANTIIKWLTHNEIDNMEAYTGVLKNRSIPCCSQVEIWSLAFTKSWFKRTHRPLRSFYNTFLTCTDSFPCTECFNHRADEERKKTALETSSEATPASGAATPSSASTPAPPTPEEAPQRPEKDSPGENGKESKNCLFSDKEIGGIINNLDKAFQEKEEIPKTDEERLYLVHMVMHALSTTPDYQMLMEDGNVDPKGMQKIFCALAVAFTYLVRIEIQPVYKLLFFLCSNINGFFFTPEGQSVSKKEFTTFLVFVQNTTAISRNKFIYLIDILSSLNQPTLAKFIKNIIAGKVTVSALKEELFREYSVPSTKEIDHFKKHNPTSIPRIFTPEIVFLHGKVQKDNTATLMEENAMLKGNIQTLLSDLKYFSTSGLIKDLKNQIESQKEDR